MNYVNAFQKIGLTITAFLAVVLFGGGFFMSSISTAKADNPNTVNSTGKIQMQVNGFPLNGKPAFHVLVWDSENGKSKMYHFDGVDKFFSSKYQLPSSPLY